MTTAKSNQFAGLAGIVKKTPAKTGTPATEQPEVVTLTPPPMKAPKARAVGKSADPDFERMTVYVRKDTKKATERKCEDDGEYADVSELVQALLTKYLSA